MSAEEFQKRNAIPEGLERAIARLAERTVQEGWDPVKVLSALMRTMQWWNSLTPEQRRAVRQALQERRYTKPSGGRKPRSA